MGYMDGDRFLCLCVRVSVSVCQWVTLNVIIECAVLVAVFAQQTESVNICKVLKLNQAVHPIPENRRAAFNLMDQRRKDRNRKLIVIININGHSWMEYSLLSLLILGPEEGALPPHPHSVQWEMGSSDAGFSGHGYNDVEFRFLNMHSCMKMFSTVFLTV